MKNPESIFDLFDHDDNFKFIMKRMLESSIEESFNSVIITEAGDGYPIVYVNPAFCEMTGYGPHEVLGKSPSLLQGEKTDPEVIQKLSEDLKAGRLFHGRAINYRRDGSTFMMEWKIVPIRGKENQVTHYLAIQHDVTGREE
ncbi:MAG: PAS domain-containing protein [Desulfobacterales bacterium]|nr:PAS domain-containing protein [Desulfobacterales bacterium]